MASIVYLAAAAPTKMAEELTLAGNVVWEALSVSEVLYLCEHHDVDVVVIAPEVEDADIVELQIRRTAMRLKSGATTAQVLWELSLIHPANPSPRIH